MSMQQIMIWGHDFLRIRVGVCLTLNHWENPCVKRKHPKIYAHSLMHSRFHLPSCFGERRDIFGSSILHSRGACRQLNLPGFLSFTFSVFPHGACPLHHLALTETLWSILIILYSILFMCVVCSSCLQNHVFFWFFHLLLPSPAVQRFGFSFVF